MKTNNKISYRFFLTHGLIIVLLVVAGCSKYLDKKPDNLLTSDMIWQTKANAEAYLNQVYSYVSYNDADDKYTRLGGSDETACSLAGVAVRLMAAGNWNPQSDYFYLWGSYYAGIRQSIVFEQNIDRVPNDLLSPELKSQYKHEVLFLRGWFYKELLRQYGPFVKLDGLLSLNEDFNQYPRAPLDSCVAAIYDLMDRAAEGLPKTRNPSDYGRPTSGACKAVKAQVALLAASPLYNGNADYANFKNKDGSPLVPTTYDKNKWKVAADAAKDVIDMGRYKLFTNLDEGGDVFDPYLSCRDVLLTNWNDEIIFSSNLIGSWYWGHEIRNAPHPAGYNMTNATQNVVDAFYMRNGKTIEDPSSGYVETGFVQHDDPAKWGMSRDGVNRGYMAGTRNMYVDREARFYAAILYNGAPVVSAPTVDDRNYFSSDQNVDGRGRTEFYYSGKSGVPTTTQDMTGYCPLKGVSPASNMRTGAIVYRPFIYIRYAEMLLNYIEALNEYDPGNADIVKYLDQIRTRAGLPGFESLYPGKVGNQDEMRKAIIRERQVELCFEGDRYYTLIRRKMMDDPKIQTIYRMNVTENDNGQGFAFENYYKREVLEVRYWDDKMYIFPIAQTDRDRDQAIVQNPFW